MNRKFLPDFLRLATGASALALAMLMGVPTASAQNAATTAAAPAEATVTGTVVDTEGEPVIGATVRTPDPKKVTSTDIDGRFTLRISKPTRLTVSYIGMGTQEMTAKPGEDVTITMSEDASALDEVVVVGFAVQKKINLTGAVGTASGKDIAERPVQNVATALQGVIPGLNIDNSSSGGELNASKKINVRGTETIGQGSKGGPLILIDGVEGDLNTINPQDIDNISVLKDAAASSIYGSRAPYGVILITTKQGAEGRTQIHYGNSFRWNKPLNQPKMMDSWQFANYANDMATWKGGDPQFDEDAMNKIWAYYNGESDYIADQTVVPYNGSNHLVFGGGWETSGWYANTDWLKEYYKDTAFSQEHNLTVNGGNEKTNYYLSGAFLDQGGFMRHGEDDYKRYNIMGKFNAQIQPWLKVGFTSKWVRTDYDRPTTLGGNFYDNVIRRGWPTVPVRDPNGYYTARVSYIEQLENGGRYKEQNDLFVNQVTLTITPIKNWNIIGEFNSRINSDWRHQENFATYGHDADDPERLHPAMDSPLEEDQRITERSYRETYLNANVYTNYYLNFAKQHNLTLLLGIQFENNKSRGLQAARADLYTVDKPVIDGTSDKDDYSMSGWYDKWSTLGFFGRINYDFDSRYLLEVNMRYDGSSRFRRDKRWVLSPSMSAGWNIARESFWADLERIVPIMKLRFSYGQLPNQNTSELYPTYRLMNLANRTESWLVNGQKPNSAWFPKVINPNMTWEKIITTNIGLDWGLFNNRLTGSFDFYWRTNKDMLVYGGIPYPQVFGADFPPENLGKMRTRGWELQVQWRDRIGKDFSYSVGVNLSDDRTKIIDYPNREGALNRYLPGEWLGNIYGLTTIGIAQSQEEMNAHLAHTNQSEYLGYGTDVWGAGDIMYKDLDGDGYIRKGTTIDDLGDLRVIGNNHPRYRIGFNLAATWKWFDISAFFQGVCKRDYFVSSNNGSGALGKGAIFWGHTGNMAESVFFEDHLDYWRNESSGLGANYDSYYARLTSDRHNCETQTRFLQNAAYLRLKNLQVGFTLPENWLNAIHFRNIRLYFSAENLVTWTKLSKLIDPETLDVGKMGAGASYPLSKTMSFGLTADF